MIARQPGVNKIRKGGWKGGSHLALPTITNYLPAPCQPIYIHEPCTRSLREKADAVAAS